jgi:hypothetical protein
LRTRADGARFTAGERREPAGNSFSECFCEERFPQRASASGAGERGDPTSRKLSVVDDDLDGVVGLLDGLVVAL